MQRSMARLEGRLVIRVEVSFGHLALGHKVSPPRKCLDTFGIRPGDLLQIRGHRDQTVLPVERLAPPLVPLAIRTPGETCDLELTVAVALRGLERPCRRTPPTWWAVYSGPGRHRTEDPCCRKAPECGPPWVHPSTCLVIWRPWTTGKKSCSRVDGGNFSVGSSCK